MGMSEKDAAFWAERRFVRELAAEVHMEFVREEVGHDLYPIESKDEFRARMDASDTDDDGKVPVLPQPTVTARTWVGDLPKPAESFRRAAEKKGYNVRATYSHQERRGMSGRLLAVPSADMCTLACWRGGERFLAIWANLKGEWKFEESLDFSPHEGIIPQMRKITALKKERLT